VKSATFFKGNSLLFLVRQLLVKDTLQSQGTARMKQHILSLMVGLVNYTDSIPITKVKDVCFFIPKTIHCPKICVIAYSLNQNVKHRNTINTKHVS